MVRDQFVSKDNHIYYVDRDNEKPFPAPFEFEGNLIQSSGREFVMIFAYPIATVNGSQTIVRWEFTYATEDTLEKFAECYQRAWTVHPWRVYRRIA